MLQLIFHGDSRQRLGEWHLDNPAYQRRQLLREVSVRRQAIDVLKGYWLQAGGGGR